MISELFTRLRFLFVRRRRVELDEELAFHLDQSIASKIQAGLPAAEARRQALVEFGGIEPTRDQCERQRPGWWLGTVLQDLRYAARGFGRNPLFTLSVLITLALGIGATTAVFSVVDRILFRPLPYADPDRIVSLGFVHSLERQEFMMGRFYVEWQKQQTPFSAITAQSTMVHNCDLVEENPAQLGCLNLQSNFLPLLGFSPSLGRNFLPEEDHPNGPHVVMISYSLWKGHFNSDPHILDRSINVDGDLSRIIGVLPNDFQFPTLQAADIIAPFVLDPAIQSNVNGGFGYPERVFARLKPGVTLAQAYAQMQPLFNNDLKYFPPGAKSEVRLSIRTLRDRETQDVRSAAWILFGFVLAVMLIACANVAGLMMARGAGRQRELAVRSAIGATRGRLARQALTEAILLSMAGGIAGLALAQGLVMLFVRLAPAGIPLITEAHLDFRIAAFAVLLSCACGIVFGLATALQSPGLAALNAKAALPRSHALLRRVLVTAQIAVSIVLLSGATLLLRSFAHIEQQNLGMQSGGVLTAKVALPWWRYNTDQKSMDFYLHLEASLRRLPGTAQVALTDSLPPGGSMGLRYSDLVVDGKPPTPPGIGGSLDSRSVTPDYFSVLNIPIVRGRAFAEQDRTSTEREVILSRLLAARLFPNEDPIGKRIKTDGSRNNDWAIVVGIADNVKNNGLTEQSDPELYKLRRSTPADWSDINSTLIIRSVMSASTLQPWIRTQVAAIDRTVPVEMESLDLSIQRLADWPRFETTLLSFFALTGLVLAAVGLYGLIAFMTTQRQREIGVRMALGATRASILGLIASDGLRMVVAGLVLGLGASALISKSLKSLLYQVSTSDPLTYIAVPVLLALVALIAILIPAQEGTRVDPAVTLRAE